MAPNSGRASVPTLCVCSVVVVYLLLADVTAASQGKLETGIVGSTKQYYLRGNPTMTTENLTEELEESYESFERRELAEGDYGGNPASANCDTNNTNCVKP